MWYILAEMSKDSNIQKVIVIVGPTASGKSDLGIKIARKYGGEIISADSRQVYRGMDIGTGKVTKKEQKMAKHYLIDVASPKKQFTASDFEKLGEKIIRKTISKGRIPIIVGGTGFYIDILVGRMAVAKVPSNKKLRAKLDKQSTEFLFKRLQKLDPEFSRTIDCHNRRRLIRALEIVITTGKPIPKPIQTKKYSLLWLGLRPKDLNKRIKKRLDERLRRGLINEVKKLLAEGISHERLESFGLEYRWISRYLRKLISKNEMKEKLYQDIIRYSKRQMTWFKKNKEINWIKNKKATDKLVATFLNRSQIPSLSKL